jgi:tetratricopeptide (TPR) repeat protein
MKSEEWRAVKDLFDRCLDAPAELRASLLSDSTVTMEVRAEVTRLLRNLEGAEPSFLKPPDAFRRAVFAAAPSLEQGEVLAGRFRVERFLGRGGMGEVYEAFDTDLNDRVALKLLASDLQDDPTASARMRRELQLARRVTHPNVCRLFDLARHEFPWGEGEFLTMEFLEGGTLSAKVKSDGPMPPGVALPLLMQIADGLEAAHSAGVIHRDLKPSNIMLTPGAERTRAVLMDFGLARRYVASEVAVTQTGQVAGTLEYMAPELFTGGAASVASDMFALGKVALFMVTGALDIADTRLPALWKTAIQRALDPDPARRFETAQEFVSGLEGRADTVTLRLPAVSRRKLTAAASAAGLAMAAGIGLWFWARAGRLPEEAERLYEAGVEQIRAGSYFAATKTLDRAANLAPHFTLAHARLAEAWMGLQIPERASREMLLARREGLSSLSELDRLQLEAIDLTVTREFPAAVAKYEQLRSKGRPEFDLDLGRAYERANRIADAKEKYRQVTVNSPRSAAAWLRLAVLRSRTGEPVPAAEAFSRAEQVYQANNDLEGLVEFTFQRGVVAARRTDYSEAKEQFQKAIATSRLAANQQQEIAATLQLAAAAYAEGDAALAEQYAREGLAVAQANQMQALAVVGIVNLGSAYAGKGDLASAERYYREGLTMADNESSDGLAALCLLSLASLHDRQKLGADMEREARQALAYYEPNGYAYETARGSILLGRYHRDQGMYAGAMEDFQRAAVMAEKAQDLSAISLANQGIASVFEIQERFPEALVRYRKNMDLPSDEQSKAYAALQTGEMLSQLGRFDEAGAMFSRVSQASARFKDLSWKLALAHARMAISQGRDQEAGPVATEGLSKTGTESAFEAAQFREVLGLALMEQGDLQNGSRACEQALTALMKIDNPSSLLDAQLAALEGRARQGDRRGTKSLFVAMEPSLEQKPESKWRTLAWMARADPTYREPAQNAFGDLKRLWGDAAWRSYADRPDIRRLSMSLFAQSLR